MFLICDVVLGLPSPQDAILCFNSLTDSFVDCFHSLTILLTVCHEIINTGSYPALFNFYAIFISYRSRNMWTTNFKVPEILINKKLSKIYKEIYKNMPYL